MISVEQEEGSVRIEKLRKNIDDVDYVHAAVHRIALILSNGLAEMPHTEGKYNERQRKRGRS
jgi:hypothetical protein